MVFLAYPKLEAVAHAGESLLCRLRDRELEWQPKITSGLLALSDAMRKILGHIEMTGAEANDDHATLIDLLVRLKDPEGRPLLASSSVKPRWSSTRRRSRVTDEKAGREFGWPLRRDADAIPELKETWHGSERPGKERLTSRMWPRRAATGMLAMFLVETSGSMWDCWTS